MRTWLFDRLSTSLPLQAEFGVDNEAAAQTRILPRRSRQTIPDVSLFLIFGLGNSTAEQLTDSTSDEKDADRQFFQVWVHDKDNSFVRIDRVVGLVKARLVGGKSPPHGLITVRYLETSGEFNNETYDTNFRYIRFQAVLRSAT